MKYEYAGPRFPYWLRENWKEGIVRIWDYWGNPEVGLTCDEETGEILVWRYRSVREGGTVDEWNCFRTSPLRDNPT